MQERKRFISDTGEILFPILQHGTSFKKYKDVLTLLLYVET